MQKTTVFDVLVVYTDGIATSASSKSKDSQLPFSKKSKRTNYNNAYSYFLEICQRNNLKAAFTTSKDLINKGIFESYWIYKESKWQKIKKNCSALFIFDKFSPIDNIQKQRRISLFSDLSIKPFNNPELFSLFLDKQKTFDKLSEYAIPTVSFNNISIKGIEFAFKKLSTLISAHPKKEDFSDELILKDRFGSGGINIYKIGTGKMITKISNILLKDLSKTFVLQPFAIFDKGYKSKNLKGSLDLRLVFMGQKIISSYTRTAKENDFRCNQHQGASLKYIKKDEIPKEVINVSKKITQFLGNFRSLYALDFLISNNGNVYLMEGNCGPGIIWDLDHKQDEFKSKKLIRDIVKEIASRIDLSESFSNVEKISKVLNAVPI